MRVSVRATVGLVCLSLLEARTLANLHASNLNGILEITAGIPVGHPFAKAFQNRLLGPEIIFWTSKLTHLSFAVCHRLVCTGLVGVANFVCYRLFLGQSGERPLAWTYTVAFAALFVGFQDGGLLYVWDYLELTLLLLFAWAVVFGRFSLRQWAVLFAVALLNRESAQFIALWIVIDSVAFPPAATGRAKIRIDVPRLATGLLLGVAGSLWTHAVREKLCAREIAVLPRGVQEMAGGQYFTLPGTWRTLRDSYATNTLTLCIFLGALGYVLSRAWPSLGGRAWKVGLLVGAMTAANFCFALVVELRVWFILLPLMLCLLYVSRAHDEPPESERTGAR